MVDNTHTRRGEYEPYEAAAAAAGYAMVIEELHCDSVAAARRLGRRNTHGARLDGSSLLTSRGVSRLRSQKIMRH